MKTFNVTLRGRWFFDFLIDAESAEEAEEIAVDTMNKESGSIDLEFDHVEVEEEPPGKLTTYRWFNGRVSRRRSHNLMA